MPCRNTRAERGTAAFCEVKCFAHLKAGVVLWLLFIHKMLSSFPVSGRVFMDREDSF